MKLSRRGFAGLAAAVPFLGGAMQAGARASGYEKMQERALFGGSLAGGNIGQSIPSAIGQMQAPKMEHWQALKLAMADPDLRREFVSECYARNKQIDAVDADLLCLKSFSPMAKITFQRQRNVEREIKAMTSSSQLGFASGAISRFINKVMWGEEER